MAQRRQRILKQILAELDQGTMLSDEELQERLTELVAQMCATDRQEGRSYLSVGQRGNLVRQIFNSLRRLDVLQDLLDEPGVTEIMVNGPDDVFVERAGRLSRAELSFDSCSKLEEIIQRMVSRVNRVVNEASPILDFRLEDGSRANVVLPPVSLCGGPVLTIRRFPDNPLTMDKLLEIGSISEEAVQFLKLAVQARYNIFISGGTGSGKTTFLNALSQYIPSEERVITIEDSAELQLRDIPNLVRLEVRNANLEGKNGISIADLVKSALRMRPDRIIVGEIRDRAVIEMLNAMNTGHDGSLSTGHANSTQDMLRRMETMYLSGMDIPLPAVRGQIASAVDLVIQLGRLRDHSRRVLAVDELVGMEHGEIVTSSLFRFEETGTDSEGRVRGSLRRMRETLVHPEKMQAAGLEWRGGENHEA